MSKSTTTTKTSTTTKKAAAKKPTQLKHDLDGFAGLALTCTSTVSGTTVNLWHNGDSGRSTDKGTWTLECEDHGKEIVVANRREAREQRPNIASWCSGCKAASKRTSRKAA